MKKIWEQHHSLIQWVVVALLAISVAIWLSTDAPEKPSQKSESAPAPEVVEPAPIQEVIVEQPVVVPVAPVVEETVIVGPPKAEEPVVEVEEEAVEPIEPSIQQSAEEQASIEPASIEPEVVAKPEPVVKPGCLEWSESAAVSRGTFTRGVDRKRREPVDSICSLDRGERRIYYFSDLRNQFGKRIHHLWEYNGKSMAKVALGRVKGPRWRVWSSKNLIPGWSGRWTVKVVDDQGNVLHQESFEYTQ